MLKIKRLLLIIAITFLILQMVVLATDIAIGNAAIDRNNQWGQTNKTMVDGSVPANDTGTITSVEIYAYANMTNVEVAIFSASGNSLTSHSSIALGSVAAGYNIFTVDSESAPISMDVVTGNYIGIYWNAGDIDIDTQLGVDLFLWYLTGDKIPCTSTTFTPLVDWRISLHGTGATVEVGTNVLFMFSNF